MLKTKKPSHMLDMGRNALVGARHRRHIQHGEGEARRVEEQQLCVEGVVSAVGQCHGHFEVVVVHHHQRRGPVRREIPFSDACT